MRRGLLLVSGLVAVPWSLERAWTAAAAVGRAAAPSSPQALDAAAAALLAPLAWLALGWGAAVVALAAAAAGDGPAARTARRLLPRVAPRTARRAAAALVGAGLALGSWTGPALAEPNPAPTPVLGSTASYDWGPASAEPVPTPAPTPTAQSGPARPGPSATAGRGPVVVRPGDTLWALAARDLAAASRATTPAAIAAEWPRWYAANRAVIGPDPGLIRPGQQLAPPAPPTPMEQP